MVIFISQWAAGCCVWETKNLALFCLACWTKIFFWLLRTILFNIIILLFWPDFFLVKFCCRCYNAKTCFLLPWNNKGILVISHWHNSIILCSLQASVTFPLDPQCLHTVWNRTLLCNSSCADSKLNVGVCAWLFLLWP